MLTRPCHASQTSAASAPAARALYLGARDKKHITCTEQALVVHNALRQTRRYPLERVSRVVSSTATDWSGDALALCLKRGIAITWVDGGGNALGASYPAQRHYPPAAAALEMLTETPAGQERYTNWLRSRRMEVLLRWGKTCATDTQPALWEATKREWVYGQRFSVHLPDALHGHCQAWASAQLANQGLPPVLWSPDAQPIHLDHDLCTLLWAEMNLCAGSLADTAQADEPTTALFERWNALSGAAVILHIHSLLRTAMHALNTLEPSHEPKRNR